MNSETKNHLRQSLIDPVRQKTYLVKAAAPNFIIAFLRFIIAKKSTLFWGDVAKIITFWIKKFMYNMVSTFLNAEYLTEKWMSHYAKIDWYMADLTISANMAET